MIRLFTHDRATKSIFKIIAYAERYIIIIIIIIGTYSESAINASAYSDRRFSFWKKGEKKNYREMEKWFIWNGWEMRWPCIGLGDEFISTNIIINEPFFSRYFCIIPLLHCSGSIWRPRSRFVALTLRRQVSVSWLMRTEDFSRIYECALQWRRNSEREWNEE